MPFTLNRRALLRGLAGGAVVSVALPPLEAMLNRHGEALSDGSPLPVRFVTFFFGNGVLWDLWNPTIQGPDWELTTQLAPLEPVKEYCSVLTGFENKIGPKITHHEGVAGMLSGHPFAWGGGLYSEFGGPSIDQVIADAIDSDHTPKSIQLGVSKRVSRDEGPTMQFISHRSTSEPLEPTYSPAQVWTDLFGSFVPPDDPRGPARHNVLDAVSEDARRLKARVSVADRQRLDAHLDGISELQAHIAQLPPLCETPAAEEERNEDLEGVEPMPEVSAAMIRLLRYAFACDLTRVCSFMLTGGVGHTVYRHLGHSEEQHFMSHDPQQYWTRLNETIVWNVQQFADLCVALRETEEGTQNLLHNSVVLLASDCGEGWSHTTYDQPIVVAGGGGGRLVHPGIHLRSPNSRNTSDVLLSCAQAVVPGITEVGSAEGYSSTPVSEILI